MQIRTIKKRKCCFYHEKFGFIYAFVPIHVEHVERNPETRFRLCNKIRHDITYMHVRFNPETNIINRFKSLTDEDRQQEHVFRVRNNS